MEGIPLPLPLPASSSRPRKGAERGEAGPGLIETGATSIAFARSSASQSRTGSPAESGTVVALVCVAKRELLSRSVRNFGI